MSCCLVSRCFEGLGMHHRRLLTLWALLEGGLCGVLVYVSEGMEDCWLCDC